MADDEKPAEEEQVDLENPETGTPPDDKKSSGAPSKVDDAEVGASERKQGFAFAQLRRERKEAFERIEKLEQDAETRETEHKQTLASYGLVDGSQPAPGTAPQPLDAEGVKSVVDSAMNKRKVADAQEDAYAYILSQDDVSEKKHVAEIQEVMRKYSLDKLAETDPHSATELALDKWRNEREAKDTGSEPTKEELASGVPSGPARGRSGKPKLTVEGIAALSDEEFAKQKSELWKAAPSEG